MADVPVGNYLHYKNKPYKVLGTAKHADSGERFIIYQAMYGDRELWIRPESVFIEFVEVDGERVPRFSYTGIDDSPDS